MLVQLPPPGALLRFDSHGSREAIRRRGRRPPHAGEPSTAEDTRARLPFSRSLLHFSTLLFPGQDDPIRSSPYLAFLAPSSCSLLQSHSGWRPPLDLDFLELDWKQMLHFVFFVLLDPALAEGLRAFFILFVLSPPVSRFSCLLV